MAPPLLLAESKLVNAIAGLPPILPRLRSGRAIPAQVAPPPEADVQVTDVPVPDIQVPDAQPADPRGPAPLFTVVAGQPDIIPPLRPAPPVVAPPADGPQVTDPATPTSPAPLFAVVAGQPDIIPPLRPTPAVVIPPEDRLPFQLVNGAPDIRPRFRPTPEVSAPVAPETAAPENTDTPAEDPATVDETTVADAPVESSPETAGISLASAVDAAINAATPPALFALREGQPALLPRLRSGANIPPVAQPVSAVDPATAEANALRPRRRPQAIIELPAPIDSVISSAAPISATRASHRNESFAVNAARIIEISTSRPRSTAPPVPADPQSVNLPTSASVARSATIENAINLRKTNLLGIFGTADNRTALIRLSSGRNIRVQMGQSFSGWTVVAISTNSVRIRKRNREEILRMPAE
jgi:type IV pilus biogenesis protein PilP